MKSIIRLKVLLWRSDIWTHILKKRLMVKAEMTKNQSWEETIYSFAALLDHCSEFNHIHIEHL